MMHRFTTPKTLKEDHTNRPMTEPVERRSSEDMPSAEVVSYPTVSEDMLQNSVKRSSPQERRRARAGRIDKTTIMIIIIIGMTMITQIPVCFVYTFNYITDDEDLRISMPDYLTIFVHWLLLVNSAADPVIYGLMNPPFRTAYLKFFNNLKYCCKKNNRTPPSRTDLFSFK